MVTSPLLYMSKGVRNWPKTFCDGVGVWMRFILIENIASPIKKVMLCAFDYKQDTFLFILVCNVTRFQ